MQTQSINATTNTVAPQQNDATELFKAISLICPIPNGPTSDVITVVIDEKHTLGKQFSVGEDGAISKTSAVSVSRGIACQYHVPDHGTLENVLALSVRTPMRQSSTRAFLLRPSAKRLSFCPRNRWSAWALKTMQ